MTKTVKDLIKAGTIKHAHVKLVHDALLKPKHPFTKLVRKVRSAGKFRGYRLPSKIPAGNSKETKKELEAFYLAAKKLHEAGLVSIDAWGCTITPQFIDKIEAYLKSSSKSV
jgi:hypothetical protein